MFKLGMKLVVAAVAFVAISSFVSGGKAEAALCQSGNAPGDNWGATLGESSGTMGGMIVHAYYGSYTDGSSNPKSNQPINTTYSLSASNPGGDQRIFQYPAGSGQRNNQRYFGTGETITSGLPPGAPGGPTFKCAQNDGWDVLGPGIAVPDPSRPGQYVDQWGDGWVLDCSQLVNGSYVLTKFWIDNIPKPGGQDGHWEVKASGGTASFDVQDYLASSPGPNHPGTYFTIKNGSNEQLDLIWHPKKPPPPPTNLGTCNYYEATGNKLDRTEVHISGVRNVQTSYDGGGRGPGADDFDDYVPSPPGTEVPNTDSHKKQWWYSPKANTIHITVKSWKPASGGGWASSVVADYDQPCFTASCAINVDGDGPGGIVLAGGTAHVRGTYWNTSPPPDLLPLINPALQDSDKINTNPSQGIHPLSIETAYDAAYGFSYDFSFDMPAPTTVTNGYFNFTPVYLGSPPGAIGGGCDKGFPVYQSFTASVKANSDLVPTTENPSSDNYSTTVNIDGTSHAVNIPTSSSFYKKPVAGGQNNINSNTGGTYTAPKSTAFSGSYDVPEGSFTAGDRYCAYIHADYTSGYVGPDNNVIYGVGPAEDTSCPMIANKPYFKVSNSAISAGGEFDKCSSDGGTLAGYNNNLDGGVDRGSSTQLSALALLKITGVASAQTIGTVGSGGADGATGLTFANKNVTANTSNESPVLGGSFGGCQTLTNASPPSSSQGVGAIIPDLKNLNGAYARTGNLKITGGTISTGHNVSLFVKGDVYIGENNIQYDSTGAVVGTVPSLVVHATGNIYISPNVTSLAGTYIAHNNGTNGGKIYTCANTGNFAPMATTQLYNSCNKQLVVYGSFVADQVNLMRSFGSLRDETPNPPAPASSQLGLVWSCGGDALYPCKPSLYGLRCTHIIEPGEPVEHTWDDNQLCLPDASPVKLAWTYDAANQDKDREQQRNVDKGTASISYLKSHGFPYCTQWNIGSGWDDNYLCSSQPGLDFKTSNDSNQYCTKMVEPSDPTHNWPIGNFICEPKAAGPTGPTWKGPYTNCSNKGLQATQQTCAGEVFEFSPAIYLANPPIRPPNNGALQLQAITSLPPVL